MAKPVKTADGTWRIRWFDQAGKRHSKTFKKYGDAVAHLKQAEAEVSRGTFVDPQRGNVPLEEWIAERRLADLHRLQPGTIRTEERAAGHILEHLGSVKLRNLSSTDIERYVGTRVSEGASVALVAMEFRILRKWLNSAVAHDRLTKNPCAKVKLPANERAEMRFLKLEELVALSEEVPERYRAWVLMMGVVGLRFSEGNGLCRKHVRLLERRIDVHEQLVYEGGKWVRKSRLKTAASRRSVSIGSPLLEILGAHIGKFSLPGDDGLIFPNRDGNPLGSSTFRAHVFKPALVRAGLDPALRIHDLRHTAVALAIAEGAHPTAIQRRMGHASISTTLGTYGHLFPELDEQLADRLGVSLQTALKGEKVLPFQARSA